MDFPAFMRLALYQPDIPPNLGTLIRLGACLGVPLDVIEPCGFPFSERALKRAALDYAAHATVRRHLSWPAYLRQRGPGRLVLLTTRAERAYTDFAFAPDDTLLLGRESAGVPDEIHAAVDARVRVPLRPGLRSLNVAVAAAMVLGEALRQTGRFADVLEKPA
ncbi:MAG TPA: tRNA (cytidine(34)-2'-O)-methyltransferase [Candidatus Sulfotelmatobacter sp.]|nr:tRNA (cytidine(34)-2'-O)-methyltransferase [Candidatus Sulfotelmatobacter sp.]